MNPKKFLEYFLENFIPIYFQTLTTKFEDALDLIKQITTPTNLKSTIGPTYDIMLPRKILCEPSTH